MFLGLFVAHIFISWGRIGLSDHSHNTCWVGFSVTSAQPSILPHGKLTVGSLPHCIGGEIKVICPCVTMIFYRQFQNISIYDTLCEHLIGCYTCAFPTAMIFFCFGQWPAHLARTPVRGIVIIFRLLFIFKTINHVLYEIEASLPSARNLQHKFLKYLFFLCLQVLLVMKEKQNIFADSLQAWDQLVFIANDSLVRCEVSKVLTEFVKVFMQALLMREAR